MRQDALFGRAPDLIALNQRGCLLALFEGDGAFVIANHNGLESRVVRLAQRLRRLFARGFAIQRSEGRRVVDPLPRGRLLLVNLHTLAGNLVLAGLLGLSDPRLDLTGLAGGALRLLRDLVDGLDWLGSDEACEAALCLLRDLADVFAANNLWGAGEGGIDFLLSKLVRKLHSLLLPVA